MRRRVFFRRPELAKFHADYAAAPPNFDHTGVTRSGVEAPAGFNDDRYRIRLGTGRVRFDSARQALMSWKMYPPGWTAVFVPDPAPAIGQTILVAGRVLFAWFLAPVRIVDFVDHADETGARYEFAIATIQGHPELGEERFLVEWNPGDDSVVYSIRAVSRSGAWYTRLFYPFSRLMQRRFGRDSLLSMQQVVRTPQPPN